MMSDELYVDRDNCTGCGNCSGTLPEIFKLGDDCLSAVIPGAAANADMEDIENIMGECPGACIGWS